MTKTATMAVAAVVLAAIIGFPLGMDQGMFIHCARVLADGGTLYTDVYDIKPPAIHGLYALALWLPGSPDAAVRVFEFAWNLAACLLMWHALRDWTTTARSSAVLVFAAILVASGHSNTAQPETFAALPLIAILAAASSQHPRRMLHYGVALGCAAALKPTLALAAIPIMAMEHGRTSRWSYLVVACTTAVVAAISLLPVLLRPDDLHALSLMIDAQRSFAATFEDGTNHLLLGATATFRWLALSVGLPVLAAAVFAYRRQASHPVVQCSVWLIAALFVSVVVEHRFHPYHLLRMAAPLALLAGVGIGHIAPYVAKHWPRATRRWRTTATGALTVGLLTTCLPLTAHKLVLGYGQLLGFNSYGDYLARRGHEGDDILAFRSVATAINSHSPARPIVLSVRAGSVLSWLRQWRFTRAASSQFVTGIAAPSEWVQAVRNDVAQATLLAIDTADVVPMLTGHNVSTLHALRSSGPFDAILKRRYVAFDTVHTFVLFRSTQ